MQASRRRRGALVLVASTALAHAAAMLPTAPGAGAAQGGPVLVITGSGFGHGVGMPQDGALAMGRKGASTADILKTFYPGTTTGTASGPVRVLLSVSETRDVTLAFPDGGSLAGDKTISVEAGESVRVGWADGSYWAEVGSSGGTTTTSSTPPTFDTTTTSSTLPTTSTILDVPAGLAQEGDETTTTTSPEETTTTSPDQTTRSRARATSAAPWRATSSGTIAVSHLGRRYRGFLDIRIDERQLLRVVNQLDVESYLKGMGEVRNPSWPPASLGAQAIAARTYAMRAMAAGGEICPDQRCQVYIGASAEYAAMNKAVNETAGQVLRHNGGLASTVYSANAGGHTATREEGFGTASDGYPYLRAAPYETSDRQPWTLRVSFADVGNRLSYQGQVTNVRIARTGPSKRALQVVIDGTSGSQTLTGRTFDARLGLKSTLFSFEVEQGSAPPLTGAPTPGGVQQVTPDEVADLQPIVLPPRPPDPPLPASLLRGTTTTGRSDDIAAPPQLRPPTTGSSNVPLAVFMILALAAAAATAAVVRRNG